MLDGMQSEVLSLAVPGELIWPLARVQAEQVLARAAALRNLHRESASWT
jgi:hypothetical protein